MIQQRNITIIRTYKPENNGMYDYHLLINDDPIETKHSARVFDYGLVNVNNDGSFYFELFKNCDSVQESDLEDENTFCVPIK